jgi:hypothetical protein
MTVVGRKNPIWRFRSMKLGDKLFLRPLRGEVDRLRTRSDQALADKVLGAVRRRIGPEGGNEIVAE